MRRQAWFGRQDKMGFYYRSSLKNRGFPPDQFDRRPVIGICTTCSGLNPCNSHVRTIAVHVRYGVLEAGGFPLEFPVYSLGAAAGGPLALVRNGDLITLDVAGRSLHLHGDQAELAARRAAWVPPAPPGSRGYVKMYVDHMQQANEGADLDFLVGRSDRMAPRDNH